MERRRIRRGEPIHVARPSARPLALRRPSVSEPANPGEEFFSTAEWNAIGQVLGLSHRERDVCRFVLEGRTRLEIAAILLKRNGTLLSAETVRVYIDRIFRKACVRDRLELALRLVRISREIESV